MKPLVERLERVVYEMDSDITEYADWTDYKRKQRWAGTVRMAIKYIRKLEGKQ